MTKTWFQEFCQSGFEEDLATHLPDRWLAALFHFEPGFDEWIEAELLAWGQHCLPDIIDTFLYGVAERLVDDEFAKMIDDLPRQQNMRRIAHLEAKSRNLQAECAQPCPHRQPRRGDFHRDSGDSL